MPSSLPLWLWGSLLLLAACSGYLAHTLSADSRLIPGPEATTPGLESHVEAVEEAAQDPEPYPADPGSAIERMEPRAPVTYPTPHVDIAIRYVGVTEEGGNNRGSTVERFLAAANLAAGHPWCGAFVAYVLDQAKALLPSYRGGVARRYATSDAVPAARILRGECVPPGTLAIWQRGQTWQGHIEIVTDEWCGPSGRTVGGNTSPNRGGSQHDGDGVWRKTRSIVPTNYFRITEFQPVAYP